MKILKILEGGTYKERLLIDYLRNPESIRECCNKLLPYAQNGELLHFNYDASKLDSVLQYVLQVIKQQFPDKNIPLHSKMRHFAVAGIDRVAILNEHSHHTIAVQNLIELVIVSVFLDAGAGKQWRYRDYLSNQELMSSEGLAAASFNLFMQGVFSSDKLNKLQVDALGLQNLTTDIFSTALQVNDKNMLTGLHGRFWLLKAIGECMYNNQDYFCEKGTSNYRLGNILHYWLEQVKDNKLSIKIVFRSLLDVFSDIWPDRHYIEKVNLGDVWPHTYAISDLNPRGFIPFHKLTQWMCYSLVEPLELLGVEVTDLHVLTALPEYRNGGLLIDFGVLTPRSMFEYQSINSVGSELVVEWRAMTVVLIDHLADMLRSSLGLTRQELPMSKILECTWGAGRKIAYTKRPNGEPPLEFVSDGTVF